MRMSRYITLSIACGLLAAANAVAQDQVQMIEPTSFSYDEYYTAQQTSPNVTSEKAPAAATASACDSACESCGQCEDRPCRWCRCGKLADPWTLPQPNMLKDRNITVGGWLEGGVYGNQYGTPENGPIGFRNIGDGFTADQLWIYAERKTDTKGCGWDIGGRVDYLFGTDGPDTQCFGDHSWDYGWNSSNDYGSAIPQIYAEIAYNDVTVKAGHFYTPIGYEVVAAPQNFFYSHSYSNYFGEPFTHTGFLASYKRNDKTTVYGGWVNGWDEGFDGADAGSMFLGGLSYNFSEKGSLAWFLTSGKIGNGTAFNGAANGDVYMNSIVFTYQLTEKLAYVLEHDLGSNYNVDTGAGAVDNQWYGITNYLTYKLNDCWSAGGRFEWFQDPQGARVISNARGDYYELTAGLNWKPHANVAVRPELRYDAFSGTAPVDGLPFHNGTSSSQLSAGCDFIFTY